MMDPSDDEDPSLLESALLFEFEVALDPLTAAKAFAMLVAIA